MTLNFFLFIVATVVTIYLLYNIYMHSETNDKYKSELESSQIIYDEAVIQTIKARNTLLDSIENYAGKEIREKIEDKKIWIGMEVELLAASWGKAADVKESYTRGVKIQKFYYNPYYNRLHNVKYEIEVTLENDIVIGWKDLI